jgi:hypothetical protein
MAYAGNIAQIPIGSKGLMSDVAPSQIPFDCLTKVINCDYGLGYIQKAPGAITYNKNALSSSIVALLDYWPTTYKQRMFAATADGKIYRDTGDRGFSLNTAIATGLGNLDNRSQFVVGGNETSGADKKIFFFSGGLAQVKVCSGDNASFSSIAAPAADWPNPTASSNPQSNFPNFGLTYRGRLWAFAKSVAYASTTSNHEDFQGATTLINNVGPGEGGDIVGAFVYKQKLLVWKRGDLLYILNDSDSTAANWYFSLFGTGLGISSWHAACQVLDDLYIGNITGKITSFKATQAYGNFTQADVFKQARVGKFFAENTSPIGNQFQHSIFYGDKGIGYFTGRTKGRQDNDCLIQLDLSQADTPKYGLLTHLIPNCLTLRRDLNDVLRPICGSTNGFVYLMDREDRAVGPMGSGSAYTGEFRTADLDMRHIDPALAHKNKIWDFLNVTFQEEGNYQLSVDVWIDGRFRETINFAQTIDTNYAGAFVLGAGNSVTGGLDEKTIQKPLHGMGRRITFRCYNSGNNQNFKVSMLSIGFRVSAEQATVL